MIVCSCNVFSDADVRACLQPGPACPRTPAQVYKRLGCVPNCGRCAATIRAIVDEALAGLPRSGAVRSCGGACCPLALGEALREEAA